MPGRRAMLDRRALRLEYFTIGLERHRGLVAIGAGVIARGVALIGFGSTPVSKSSAPSGCCGGCLGPDRRPRVAEESTAEKRALCVVATTFLLLAGYITYEAIGSLLEAEELLTFCFT
jgi:hypothetical protein